MLVRDSLCWKPCPLSSRQFGLLLPPCELISDAWLMGWKFPVICRVSCLHCLRPSFIWMFAFDPFNTIRCQGLWKQLKINLENSEACSVAVVKCLLLRTVADWNLCFNFLAFSWMPVLCWIQHWYLTAFVDRGLRFDVCYWAVLKLEDRKWSTQCLKVCSFSHGSGLNNSSTAYPKQDELDLGELLTLPESLSWPCTVCLRWWYGLRAVCMPQMWRKMPCRTGLHQ